MRKLMTLTILVMAFVLALGGLAYAAVPGAATGLSVSVSGGGTAGTVPVALIQWTNPTPTADIVLVAVGEDMIPSTPNVPYGTPPPWNGSLDYLPGDSVAWTVPLANYATTQTYNVVVWEWNVATDGGYSTPIATSFTLSSDDEGCGQEDHDHHHHHEDREGKEH